MNQVVFEVKGFYESLSSQFFFLSTISRPLWGFINSTNVSQGATPCVLNVGPRGIEPGNFR